MRFLYAFLVPLIALSLVLAACGGDDDDDVVRTNPADTGATGSTASPSGPGESLTLGDTLFMNHGTSDVAGQTAVDLEADSFYFEPTFLRGTPGQTITLNVTNESDAIHNISITEQGVDTDIQAGQQAEVEVTMPDSGVLLFVCKYHAGQGMNGELLAGDAEPAAP